MVGTDQYGYTTPAFSGSQWWGEIQSQVLVSTVRIISAIPHCVLVSVGQMSLMRLTSVFLQPIPTCEPDSTFAFESSLSLISWPPFDQFCLSVWQHGLHHQCIGLQMSLCSHSPLGR